MTFILSIKKLDLFIKISNNGKIDDIATISMMALKIDNKKKNK